MLSNFVSRICNMPLLTLQLRENIVVRYQKRRSMYDKTTFNEQWVPKQKVYHKTRKPRQGGWTDPNTIYPVLIPPLYKPCSYKHYVRTVLEAEERQKSFRSKEFLMSDIRAGDIIEITYQDTFQSEQTVTHKCLVLAFKRRNSFTAALEVAIRFGGMSIRSIYLIHSPRIRNIKLVSKGSGNFKANLKHNWQKLNKAQLTHPKIKKGVMKSREGGARKPKKAPKSGINYDKIESDNVKRIL